MTENKETHETSIAFLEDKELSFYDKIDILLHPGDSKLIFSVFDAKQARLLKAIIQIVKDSYDFHTTEEDSPHCETLGKELNAIVTKLSVHRHQLDKAYSAKAEF
jgi:hypothetical protein